MSVKQKIRNFSIRVRNGIQIDSETLKRITPETNSGKPSLVRDSSEWQFIAESGSVSF